MTWGSFVAMGDSFTEGMNDAYPDGTYRGWADLVAARLAVEAGPDFGYANLAVRGNVLQQVLNEQLEPALAMRPSLVSFAAGGNDVLRRKVDPWGLVHRIDPAIARLRAAGADVILFRFADVTSHLPGQRIVGPRAAALNDGIKDLADRHGAILIDLFADKAFRNPLLWSADRLHMSPAGHRRVAAHVLNALGCSTPSASACTTSGCWCRRRPRRRPGCWPAAPICAGPASTWRPGSGDGSSARPRAIW
jgi:lysophospholipase L1-like esterase